MDDVHIPNHRPHRMPSISGAAAGMEDRSDANSSYSMRSNPFYPSAGQALHMHSQMKGSEDRKQIYEKKEQLVADWGFQNEETKKLFEARFMKQMQGKLKKKQMTAAEKYDKLMAMKGGGRK